jgi:hypothetical protein
LRFPLALGKDLLQPFPFNSNAGAGSAGHLLGDFKPVHSHGYRILCRHLFAKNAWSSNIAV